MTKKELRTVEITLRCVGGSFLLAVAVFGAFILPKTLRLRGRSLSISPPMFEHAFQATLAVFSLILIIAILLLYIAHLFKKVREQIS